MDEWLVNLMMKTISSTVSISHKKFGGWSYGWVNKGMAAWMGGQIDGGWMNCHCRMAAWVDKQMGGWTDKEGWKEDSFQ